MVGAEDSDDENFLMGKWFGAGERLVRESGLPWTIIRVNCFHHTLVGSEADLIAAADSGFVSPAPFSSRSLWLLGLFV